MKNLVFDEAWCVSFNGPNGLDEIDLPATNLTQAKAVVKKWAEKGWENVTIKFYKDGDIRHQWDLLGGKWSKYE